METNEKVTYCLDIDDGSTLRTRWDLLDTLKEAYPNLKVTLFWIPFDYEMEMSHLRIYHNEGLEKIKERLDWVQLCPHGITHLPHEFKHADYKAMRAYLDSIETEMKKEGLPVQKIFKAPFWEWNEDVVKVLDEYGWAGAVDRNQDMLRTKKYYVYDYGFEEPFWESKKKLLRLHGHMTPPSANALEWTITHLMKMDKNAEFKLVSELIQE